MDVRDSGFYQDGATAHTARRPMEVLRDMFPGKVMAIRDDLGWSARSPDLALCDFFLCGYFKSKAYTHRPQTLETLKNAIRSEIAVTYAEMAQRVIEAF
ncbi:hypothetical protein PR048_028639 [Dryococelus australis]|uniref:Transposase n=1 Tax=Dryococelus australis TaxID=614101 RepID=A0ABQ9GB73_9NEOP|nr:hypothetical protein PR048_028639 [Dryococelus australis]